MSALNAGINLQNNGDPSLHDVNPLRRKIVEILANTANGCLSELGYYPGMAQRIQELETQNSQWQSENVKLFQDNRALSSALRTQTSDSKKKIVALENQLQLLLNEKNLLAMQNELLVSGQPVGLAYQQLHDEYRRLYAYYTAARTEITQLREYINQITGGRFSSQNSSPNSTVPSSAPLSPSALGGPHIVGKQDAPQPPEHAEQSTQFTSASAPPTPIVAPPQHAVEGAVAGLQRPEHLGRIKEALSVISDWKRQSGTYLRTPVSPSIGSLAAIPTNRSASLAAKAVTPSSANVVLTPPTSSVTTSQNVSYASGPSANSHSSQDTSQGPSTSASHPTSQIYHQSTNDLGSSDITMDDFTEGELPHDALPLAIVNAIVPTPLQGHSLPTPVQEAPAAESDTLKRENDSISQKGPSPKRPRVDELVEVESPAKIESDSDDEIVEVGPDGLRLVEDCVAALIDDDENIEGQQHCKLCVARYNMGYVSEPPQPFQGAALEELVLHCSSEHEAAWNDLRRVS